MRLHHNILTSYHYFEDYDFNQIPNLIPIADSGAFSAASQGSIITVDGLAEWAKEWHHRFKWIASLDVIGDEHKSRANWRRMTEHHQLETVPTIHYGQHPSTIDYYADAGADLIGLGGMVGTHTNKQLRWALQVFKHAAKKYPHIQFHGWGATAKSILRLPWYSVDSSGWTGIFRFGNMQIFDPETGNIITVQANGKDLYKNRRAVHLLRNFYGIAPNEVAVSNPQTRERHTEIASKTLAAREDWFNRMHGAPHQPTWAVNPQVALQERALTAATARIPNATPDTLQTALTRSIHAANSDSQLFHYLDTPYRTIHAAGADTSRNSYFKDMSDQHNRTPQNPETTPVDSKNKKENEDGNTTTP